MTGRRTEPAEISGSHKDDRQTENQFKLCEDHRETAFCASLRSVQADSVALYASITILGEEICPVQRFLTYCSYGQKSKALMVQGIMDARNEGQQVAAPFWRT